MWDKFINWFFESNHYKHCIVGAVIMIIMLLLCSWISVSLFASGVVSFTCVLIAMATAEYKDKLHGGLFDWEDILSGMLVPCLILLFVILWSI